MNNLRRLYYYFGRNEKWGYPAIPMQSALVVGRVGSGKSTLLNSILVKLIQECNPSMLDIRIHGFKGGDSSIWSDLIPEGRRIPHVSQIEKYSVRHHYSDTADVSDYRHDFKEFVKELNNLADVVTERVNKCEENRVSDYTEIMSNGECKDKTILLIIDEFQVITEDRLYSDWFNETVCYINGWSNISGVYIMLSSQNFSGLYDSTIESFKLRAALPVEEDTSNLLLGNNCAAMEKEKYGIVWVKNSNDFPVRLFVPFYPVTWLRKFIGYSSVRV